MSRRRSAPPKDGRLEEAVKEDLESLRSTTDRNIPTLNSMARIPETRADREESSMSFLQTLTGKPWALTAAAAVVVGLALLVVPVSYERAVGQDVTLELGGGDLDENRVHAVAQEFQKALGVDGLALDVAELDGQRVYTLRAMVPLESQVNPRVVADTFAATLDEQGYEARATVVQKVERISGTVYAMARDRVIRVSIDGKSDAELEAEIRAQLLEAGVHDPQVRVTSSPEEMRVDITSDVHHEDPHAPEPEEGMMEVVLSGDGQTLVPSEDSIGIRESIRVENGVETRVIEVVLASQKATVEIQNAETMSDPALATEIRNQLRAQGVDVEVSVEEGRLTIEKR